MHFPCCFIHRAEKLECHARRNIVCNTHGPPHRGGLAMLVAFLWQRMEARCQMGEHIQKSSL